MCTGDAGEDHFGGCTRRVGARVSRWRERSLHLSQHDADILRAFKMSDHVAVPERDRSARPGHEEGMAHQEATGASRLAWCRWG